MYQDFNIISISTSLSNKNITILTNLDVNPESANGENIVLFDKNNSVEVLTNFKTKNRIIEVDIINDVQPNSIYILKVQNIKSVLGDKIANGIRKEIIFKSEIRETPVITSPAEYEKVKDINLKLKTVVESGYEKLQDINYSIEISKDMGFIDIVLKTITSKEETDFSQLENGQYYIRARVEKEIDGVNNVGKWSDVVSFISNDGQENNEMQYSKTYYEETILINSPINNYTPEYFLFEFSDDIKIEDVKNILITRRDM